jgi:hypothetical protein
MGLHQLPLALSLEDRSQELTAHLTLDHLLRQIQGSRSRKDIPPHLGRLLTNLLLLQPQQRQSQGLLQSHNNNPDLLLLLQRPPLPLTDPRPPPLPHQRQPVPSLSPVYYRQL